MNKSVLRLAALTAAAALVIVAPVDAATKKKAPAKKPAPKVTKATTPASTAAPSTAAPTTAAPTTAAPPAAPAKPSGAPIKIGFISAETGNASSAYKNAVKVAKVWEKWVNEEMGGIAGRPVEVSSADNKNTAADTQAVARDLVENKGVIALILQDSTAESALQAFADDRKFPIVGGSANNAAAGIGYGKSLYYFTTATSGAAPAQFPALIAQKLGQAPLITAVCAEVAACAASSAIVEAKAKEIGLAYQGNLTVLGSSPNYTAECLDIQSRIAGTARTAGYVNVGLAPTAYARLVRDCDRQKYQGWFGASANTASESALDGLPDVKVGGYINGFPWWSEAAPVKRFKDAMKQYDSKADYRDPASTSTWTALELFRKVMAKAPANATKDDVLKAYWQVKDETLEGLLPKAVTFAEGRPGPLLNCMWPYTYQKGKFSTLVMDANSTGNGQTNDLRTFCM